MRILHGTSYGSRCSPLSFNRLDLPFDSALFFHYFFVHTFVLLILFILCHFLLALCVLVLKLLFIFFCLRIYASYLGYLMNLTYDTKFSCSIRTYLMLQLSKYFIHHVSLYF